MTNLERMRCMSAEEVAEVLANFEMEIYSEMGATLLEKEEYVKPLKEWLESEYEAG